jgi:hypothetical membrane protein
MSSTTVARTRTTTGTAARLGAAGIAAFFAASIGVAAVTPAYRTTRDSISSLAGLDSPYAYVMVAGFLTAAAALVATGVALWQRYGATASGKVAAIMLLLCGPLMGTAGLARVDCSDAVATCIDHGEAPLASTHFWVHQYVSLLMFVTLVAASFVLIRAVRRTEGFGHLKVPARIVAWSSLLFTVATVTVGFGQFAGLAQRPFIALLFGWPVVLATVAARR